MTPESTNEIYCAPYLGVAAPTHTTITTSAAVPVKVDATYMSGNVLETTTSDTGAGVVVGVCVGGTDGYGYCPVATSGYVSMILGTGTCTKGSTSSSTRRPTAMCNVPLRRRLDR